MSIINKLINRIKGTVNDALDNTEDLGASARQNARNLDAELAEAESTLLDVLSQAELLRGQQADAQADVDRWMDAAKNAANKDDALARECLTRKASAAATLKQIQEQIANFQPTVDAINARVSELRTEVQTLQNQADLIGVRSSVAEVELRAAAVLNGVNANGVSVAETEKALARKEARAKAATTLANQKNGDDLEDRVAALNAAPSIEDELAALKAAK